MNEMYRCPNNTEPYIIQEGDTLYQIAMKFNVSLDAIVKANPNVNPYMLFVGQVICVPRSWKAYSNDDFNVSFMYPSAWKKTDKDKYEGEDGFFQLAAIHTKRPISNVSNHEAFNRKRDYGSNPKFIKLEIENQEANLIYPSFDQNRDMNNISALIVKYPKPIKLKQRPYDYLILWCNKGHIRQIGNTLRFNKY